MGVIQVFVFLNRALLPQKFLQVGQFHPDYSFLHKSSFLGMGSPAKPLFFNCFSTIFR
jgi:hypothetical protein